MQKYINNVAVANGAGALRAISGALITVTNLDGSAATIYDNNGGSARTDPLYSDDLGYFAFYAADGRYTITITKTGITTISIADVLLEDPIDGIAFQQPETGAVASSTYTKLRERKSIMDFMDDALKDVVRTYAVYTSQNHIDMLAALNAAWTSAITTPHDLFFPAGFYQVGDANWPFRQSIVVSLLDCMDVTIYCDGPGTIFSTFSPDGADVLQLNGLKNFHVKGFPTITPILTGLLNSGSNGCSITNGYDNISLELTPVNCPGVDKGTNIDGGKGLSVQCSTATLEVGSLRAIVNARGCSIAFDFAGNLFTFLNKKVDIDVELHAEDCYGAVVIGSAAATGAIPAGTHGGIRVRGKAVNCQRDVTLARAHGVDVAMQISTTKTAAARRLDFNGTPFITTDPLVEALQCTYAKNTKVSVSGNKGECDYKARIGGSAAGSSGLNGATEYSKIYLDIGGTAATANIEAVNSGGNTMRSCELDITATTATTIPSLFLTFANQNIHRIDGTYKNTYTATLTGVTTTVQGTVSGTIVGNTVTLNLPALSGVSNTTVCTITGMPAEFYPSATQYPGMMVTDNSVVGIGRAIISTAGLMTLNKLDSATFTSGNNKGIPACTITYQRF